VRLCDRAPLSGLDKFGVSAALLDRIARARRMCYHAGKNPDKKGKRSRAVVKNILRLGCILPKPPGKFRANEGEGRFNSPAGREKSLE
jgi:hypothetical protein